MAYIPGTLYDNFDIDGKPKTKEVKQKEAIAKKTHKILHGGKERPVFEPTKLQIDKYNNWLEEFQEDIQKIIGKYRYSNHLLSKEELTSEINLSLLKKRSDLILYMKNNKGFNQVSFKHCAFIYARNLVKWSHLSLCNKSYVKRRVDGTVYDEDDGYKSTFEAIVDKEGIEDDGYNFDDKNKQKALLKIIKEYSSLLTSHQKIVFTYLEKGLTHEQIANKLGITHQAISLCFIDIKNRIKTQFGDVSLKDNSYDKVSKGKIAIKQFFEPAKDLIIEKDREKLKVIMHLHPNEFTAKNITEMFFNNRYNHRQIVSCCVKKGWSSFLKKSEKTVTQDQKFFNKKNEKEMLKLLKEGCSTQEIADILGIPFKSAASKRGSLSRKGLIPKVRVKNLEGKCGSLEG